MALAFSRSKALFAMIAAAMGNASLISGLPSYVSRGKGLGKHSGKKWSQSSGRNMHVVNGKWVQIENGAREVARRLRQADHKLLESLIKNKPGYISAYSRFPMDVQTPTNITSTAGV